MNSFRSNVTTYVCFVRQEMCSRSLSQAIIVIMQLLLVSPSHKVGYTMQCIFSKSPNVVYFEPKKSCWIAICTMVLPMLQIFFWRKVTQPLLFYFWIHVTFVQNFKFMWRTRQSEKTVNENNYQLNFVSASAGALVVITV